MTLGAKKMCAEKRQQRNVDARISSSCRPVLAQQYVRKQQQSSRADCGERTTQALPSVTPSPAAASGCCCCCCPC